MDTCTQCGAELGTGRFCTSCGHPATASDDPSWRTDTAERPRVTVPPPGPTAMPEPRFPLFAEEDEPAAETEVLGPVPAAPTHRDHESSRTAGWVPWVAGVAVLAMVGSLGAWLLLGGEERTGPSVLAQETPSQAATPEDSPLVTPAPTPTRTREAEPTPTDAPADLAPTARVSAPRAAPTSQDADGNVVTFAAANMLDDAPETAWRMPGDGTDQTIIFRWGAPAVLTEIGLINGYAKVGEDSRGLLDWYAGNRRLEQVEWSFDDGTVVTQTLTETAAVQVLELDDVETRTATLRLVSVSEPGTGRASRDYTAISDVRLLGTQAP